MNKRRAILLSTIAIISLVLITVGVTVAFFNYSKQGSTENVIKSGGITFYYDEVDKNGNGINLVDALPTPDSEGKAQTNGFNFKVEGVGTENISIPYEITLRKKLGSDDIDNIVKVYLAKTSASNAAVNTEEEVITSLYSSLEDTTHNGYSEKVLYNGLVPATTNSYTQNYRLKLWIDNDTDYSEVEGVYPYEDKTFTVMVNVYANGRVLTEESKRANISTVAVGNTVLTEISTDHYETTLPEGTTSAVINVETENPYSQVTITKTQSDYTTPIAVSKNVNLTEGNNYFKIVVTSEDGKVEKTKEVMIKVKKSVNLVGLAKMVFDDNTLIETEPTLTTTSQEANENGLYALEVINGYSNGVDGTTYYFRGNVTNNYVDFAGKIWRIVRINEDGTIRLILDDSIDTTNYKFNSNASNYTKMYYSNSDIVKPTLNTWYDNNIGNNQAYASKMAIGMYFCESAKVIYSLGYGIGNINTSNYYNYLPDYKCEMDGNNHGVLDNTYKIGLITYDEVMFAGGKYDQTNTNYYLYKNYSWWTMSPAGSLSVSNGYLGWAVFGYGTSKIHGFLHEQYIADSNHFIRPVINLKADVTATGTGTSSNPYVVE